MGLKLKTASNGSVSLEPTNTASDYTLTVPAQTSTIITKDSTSGMAVPAFSAYNSAGQTISGSTWTKITFDTEEFDTNNNFSSSRFTPAVAGYYQISWNVEISSNYCSTLSHLYKNGSNSGTSKQGQWIKDYGGGTVGSCLIYANGSTDYFEIYVNFSVGQSVGASQQGCYFQGVLVRAA
jgi:hypothetical protein